MRQVINILQNWAIPLIAGVFAALLVANVAPNFYHIIVHEPITQWDEILAVTVDHGDAAAVAGDHAPAEPWWAHYITMHFLVNDLFMVLFFGLATKEIVESFLPGGALNPPSKAINPLLGTLGGVLGPIGVYLVLNLIMGRGEWARGWGIPTATDIALAWLIARMVFGPGHPAISFLLLLAVVDDAIGLGIIAFGYPDPNHPTEWLYALWIVPGMAAAFALRKLNVRSWLPYIFIGGGLSWWGLYNAHLHPALALVPIIPFLPAGKKDLGIFAEYADYETHEGPGRSPSTLENFEHQLKLPVDFGLFFFAFANAGVGFETINNLTLIVFLALLLGKVIGITGFSYAGSLVGFPLPAGMRLKHLFVASIIAGTGLTVALFVAGQAFPGGSESQAAAKMGALFSGAIFVIALVVGRLLGVKDQPPKVQEPSPPAAHPPTPEFPGPLTVA